MNRNDEFFDLANQLNDTPPELENTVKRAQARARKRKVPVRVLIAVACVAAALAAGAVAMELTAPRVSEIEHGVDIFPDNWVFPDDEMERYREKNYIGYTVAGTAEFDWSRTSRELRAAVAAAAEAAGTREYSYRTAFDSQAELEEFLGFQLPENQILDAGQEAERYFLYHVEGGEDEPVSAFAHLYISGKEETGPIGIDITIAYWVQVPNHTEHIRCWYDEEGVAHYEGEKPTGASYSVCTNDVRIEMTFYGHGKDSFSLIRSENPDSSLSRETYVTPGGREVVIIVEGDSPDWERCTAYFTLDGMTAELYISGSSCKDVKEILYSILDAYDTSR